MVLLFLGKINLLLLLIEFCVLDLRCCVICVMGRVFFSIVEDLIFFFIFNVFVNWWRKLMVECLSLWEKDLNMVVDRYGKVEFG